MSGRQNYYDEEFRAMTEGITLKEPHRLYKAMAWLRLVFIAGATMAGMLVCTIIGGAALYAAPVIFLIGVLLTAWALPKNRARQDFARAKARIRKR